MKKTFLLMSGAFLLSATTALAGGHWSYSGHSGPEHWAELNPAFSACGNGVNQSPVNLSNMVEAQLSSISINYQKAPMTVLNNGHTIEVKYQKGSTLTVDGHSYTLKQFHFHTPSENEINGKSFPLEAHLVHADAHGNLAVVAVLYKEGAANKTIASVWKNMPMTAGTEKETGETVNAADLLPANHDYYRFNGSLTTPPCSEGVLWIVMKNHPTVSAAQVAKLNKALGFNNNRPVQPLNARLIMQ